MRLKECKVCSSAFTTAQRLGAFKDNPALVAKATVYLNGVLH